MNTAIIVAAGSGQRFGGKTPKQFLKILGKPIIVYAIEQFESCRLIDNIVLVLSAAEMYRVEGYQAEYGFSKLSKAVKGGKFRAQSVLNGLNSISGTSPGIVAVHDGARPLVTPEEIEMTVKSAEVHGAACLATAVTDTIKLISGNRILETVDRVNLRSAVTPQCFRYELIRSAFDNMELDETITDESSMVEKMGRNVVIVEGSSRNIKVTTRQDLFFVETILKG